MVENIDNRVLKKGVTIGRGSKQFKGGTQLGDIPSDILDQYKPDKLKKLSELPPNPEKKTPEPPKETPKSPASSGVSDK